MRPILATAAAVLAGACGARPAHAPPPLAPKSPELQPAIKLDEISNGVTTTRDGRVFLVLQRRDPGDGPEVVEVIDGAPRPYPDAAWNAWKPGEDAATAFVAANALRMGPDGALWVVDRGAVRDDTIVEPNGPKLVAIDVAANRVTRTYPLTAAAPGTSFVDDVRFDGRHAYLTDAGKPAALIVLDLASGAARRVLEDDPSTVAQRPLTGEGQPLVDAHEQPIVMNADQLEVSPDGRWLYYQPCTGPMSKIETRYLDDPTLSKAVLAAHVQPFADTHSTGGTAIDATGMIYASDTDTLAIRAIDPDGHMSTVIRDPRLVWADAMWIDDAGTLWIPAAQIDRVEQHHGGRDAVHYPVVIYTLAIGAPPERR